jgi:hypothetical protein
VIIALVMVIGLIAPATTQASDPPFVILQRDGSLKRSDGGAIANVRGIETAWANANEEGFVVAQADEIRLLPIDGAESKLLLKYPARLRFAELSPDGEFLVFSATVTNDPEIFLATRGADERFENPRRIARGYGPSFSSDGRFIYFEGRGDGLRRFDAHQSVTEPFLPNYPGAHTVRCSRDGKWIAFSLDRALYVCRTSDQSVTKLTDGKSYDRFPSFIGGDILFVRQTREDKQQVVAIRTDATNERVLYEGDVMLVCALPAKH